LIVHLKGKWQTHVRTPLVGGTTAPNSVNQPVQIPNQPLPQRAAAAAPNRIAPANVSQRFPPSNPATSTTTPTTNKTLPTTTQPQNPINISTKPGIQPSTPTRMTSTTTTPTTTTTTTTAPTIANNNLNNQSMKGGGAPPPAAARAL